MTKFNSLCCLALFALIGLFKPVFASPIADATYSFNNTLAANESGVASLQAINPLGLNGFITDTVFGSTQTVYRFDGNRTPSEQAGLSLNTTGLLDFNDAFTIDMIFQFESNDSSWENIFGVSNRQSDNAFYVEPGNHLQVWPTGGGPSEFTFGDYHRVSLTNDGLGHVSSYLDGTFQFDLTTTSMDFSAYGAANPDRLIHFFADNLVGGGQGEFVDGRVAQIRLYDIELNSGDISNIGNISTVPEPSIIALFAAGLFGIGFTRRLQS